MEFVNGINNQPKRMPAHSFPTPSYNQSAAGGGRRAVQQLPEVQHARWVDMPPPQVRFSPPRHARNPFEMDAQHWRMGQLPAQQQQQQYQQRQQPQQQQQHGVLRYYQPEYLNPPPAQQQQQRQQRPHFHPAQQQQQQQQHWSQGQQAAQPPVVAAAEPAPAPKEPSPPPSFRSLGGLTFAAGTVFGSGPDSARSLGGFSAVMELSPREGGTAMGAAAGWRV